MKKFLFSILATFIIVTTSYSQGLYEQFLEEYNYENTPQLQKEFESAEKIMSTISQSDKKAFIHLQKYFNNQNDPAWGKESIKIGVLILSLFYSYYFRMESQVNENRENLKNPIILGASILSTIVVLIGMRGGDLPRLDIQSLGISFLVSLQLHHLYDKDIGDTLMTNLKWGALITILSIIYREINRNNFQLYEYQYNMINFLGKHYHTEIK